MTTPRSRYRPDAAPDYGHRFHAGNVGDVWKHCALVTVLRAVVAAAPNAAYVDTHAGCGSYPLGATGEWTEGIGRLWNLERPDGEDAVARYLACCRQLARGGARPDTYPGSPAFARAVLGPTAALSLWERDERACARLRAALPEDAHTRSACADGLQALRDELTTAAARADAVVALIDPPYSQKGDWTVVPDAVIAAATAAPHACLLLWYPVKSLTRPNAMIDKLRSAGLAGTVAELITTPLEHQRNRLNGSGVLLLRPPAGTLEAIAAAAPVIGTRCATRPDAWSFRMVSW